MPRAHLFSTETMTDDLVTKKLASSGLSPESGAQLHVHGYTPAETHALHPTFRAVRSLCLPYHDPLGNPLGDWPNAPGFYRLRYLETVNDFSQVTTKSTVRYVQLPNTAPVAYYPTNCDWTTICDDPEQPLIITEGELKAAKACQEGFPTIGIGGVHSWRAHKLGVEWLTSLDYITWLRRNVYLCYDSDLRSNPNVQHALWGLAEALQRRGAFVSLITLPSEGGEQKVGLDDFLLGGPLAIEQFRRLLHEAEPLGLTAVLFNYNTHYIYIRHPGLIVDLQHADTKIAPGPFKEHVESTKQYQERRVKTDGTVSYQMVSAAAAWLQWPLRRCADQLTYQPGGEREIVDGCRSYNIWPGWGVKPKAGEVTQFLALINHLFHDAEPAAKQWFLQWCAYPLQYPGTKLFSSAVMHGIRHGTGKSLVGYTLGRIYGKNFVEIKQIDLHSNFNEWAEAKQFVLGDDVTGSNKRQEGDVLKKLITQRELRVNTKFVPSYVVPDCINYYFTSNHPDAFFLEDDDRRFFIHEVTVTPLNELFYAEYDLWLDTGGAAAVFDYLLHLNLGDFNPAAPAVRTLAKERMIADGQSDLGAWVRALQRTPDFLLKVGEITLLKDLYTAKELLSLYDPSGKTGTTANGLGRELRRAGIKHVLGGKSVRLPDGSQNRYYAVRQEPQWTEAQPQKIIAHLVGPSTAATPPPKY